MHRIISLLSDLVAYPTISADSNLKLIGYIADYLKGYGIESFIDYNEERSKANMLAVIGPKKEGGIILSGHTDVVPVKGQDWLSDPFALTQKENQLFGRGTADMKGFIATALSLVPEWSRMQLERPIYLAFSYDEEVGCAGVPSLIAHMVEHIPSPALAIIGEPTQMQFVTAHKSIAAYRTTITGVAAHSSCMEEGVSAIMLAQKVMQEIKNLWRRWSQAKEPDFTPPYSTFNIGQIQGGTAINIIPEHCSFDWEIRLLPGQDTKQFEQELASRIHQLLETHAVATIETTPLCAAPALKHDQDHALYHQMLNLTHSNQTHSVSFATEAGLFQQAGIPAIICGPGSIEQAHKPNEFIEVEQLEQAEIFLRKVIKNAQNV